MNNKKSVRGPESWWFIWPYLQWNRNHSTLETFVRVDRHLSHYRDWRTREINKSRTRSRRVDHAKQRSLKQKLTCADTGSIKRQLIKHLAVDAVLYDSGPTDARSCMVSAVRHTQSLWLISP